MAHTVRPMTMRSPILWLVAVILLAVVVVCVILGQAEIARPSPPSVAEPADRQSAPGKGRTK